MFFPLHLSVSYWPALWNAWLNEIADEHFREEMRLQIELADTGNPERTVERLERIGPAARAFLARQQFMTSLGANPFVHWWERYWLQVFVFNFLRLEHDLAQEAGTPHQMFRDLREPELCEMVAANGDRFHKVIAYGQLPLPLRQQVAQDFAQALRQSQLQMG